MTGNKLFDCQQMFRHACAFADCADFAMKEFDPQKTAVEWYATPAAVNAAFACEVYLKALLKYNDIPVKKEHRLKELYELLPEKTREWIKLMVMNNHGGRWEDAFGHELLDSISDAFVDWRYSYEIVGTKRASMQINTGFLTASRNALREACCQLFFGKTWEEYLAN